MEEGAQQTALSDEEQLASNIIRRCAACGKDTLLHFGGPDDWNMTSVTSELVGLHCANCQWRASMFNKGGIVAAIIFGVAMLSLLRDDGYLPWMLADMVANPAQTVENMGKYGAGETILVITGLMLMTLFFVGLPLYALVEAGKSLWTRFHNPVVQDVMPGDISSESHAYTSLPVREKKQMSSKDVGHALGVAVVFQVVFVIIFALAQHFTGASDLGEEMMREWIKPLLLSSGLILGTYRWLTCLFWFLLLPVSTYLMFILDLIS